jgi:hypothetical protein
MIEDRDVWKAEAGRELDALVAERIFLWERVPVASVFTGYVYHVPGAEGDFFPASVPHYSGEASSAWWRVVIELRRLGVWTEITTHLHTETVSVTMGIPSSECQASAETAALAVSRCAVIASRKFRDTIAAHRGK